MCEACVQSSTEAFLLRGITEESQQVFNDLGVARFVGSVNAVLPHPVVFRKIDRLAPLLVAAVDIGRNATEFKKLVRGQFRSKSNHVEVVEAVNRLAKSLIIFIFNVKFIECFVHRAQVKLLDILEVRLSKLKSMWASSSKLTDDTRVVNVLLGHFHQSCELIWVVFEVVADSLVHEFCVPNLGNRLQEQIIVERVSSLHHDLQCIVMLLIMHVQVDSRVPQTGTFAGTNNLGHIKLAEEDLAMLHGLIRNVLGVKNTQFSENANVSIIKTKSLLEQRNDVIEMAQIRIVGNNLVDVIRVLDNLKTASGCKSEFVCSEASKANLFPR
mmetsp:Transcript_43690/g.105380  ORF Transcript_43690/g.105380 Transcript_43690/m.105380 type:complete len:327 (+) Transcript_43690:573-1553(+)